MELKIDEIIKQKQGQKGDGKPYTLTTFKGSSGYDHITANTFHFIEVGRTYEGEIIKPTDPKWLPKFDVKDEIIQTEIKKPELKPEPIKEPNQVIETLPDDIDITYIKMNMIRSAVEHYKNVTAVAITTEDIIKTAEKWLEWVMKK